MRLRSYHPWRDALRRVRQPKPHRVSRRGFTLVEVVVAMGLTGMLVGGVFAVGQGAVKMSRKVTRAQHTAMQQYAFTELVRKNFEQMPGNAQVLFPEAGSGESELILSEYPLAFDWPGVPAGYQEVILRTVRESRGSLKVVLQYLNEEEAEERESNPIGTPTSIDLGVSLSLMDNVRALQWEFWDTRTEEWETQWEDTTRRPSLVALNLELFESGEQLRSVFWIPTTADPQQFANSFQQGGGQTGDAADAGPANPGRGGNNPVTIPNVQN